MPNLLLSSLLNCTTSRLATVKCRYNEMSLKCQFLKKFIYAELSTGKNDGFWLLWGILKKCIKQDIIMAVIKSQ